MVVAQAKHSERSKSSFGAIAGQVQHHRFGLITKQKVIAKNLSTGYTKTGTTDRLGLFRIDKLPLGEYDVTAVFKNHWGGRCQKVEVKKDSLSVVGLGLDSIRTSISVPTYNWEGLTFPSCDAFGHLSGFIKEKETGKPIAPYFEITPISNTLHYRPFRTFDKTGHYFVAWIPTGIHTVAITSGGFTPVRVLEVRVAPDSISILNAGMQPLLEPTDTFIWKEHIESKKFYFRMGALKAVEKTTERKE
jgi:hypothetical protein